jgi:hypothetical protein
MVLYEGIRFFSKVLIENILIKKEKFKKKKLTSNHLEREKKCFHTFRKRGYLVDEIKKIKMQNFFLFVQYGFNDYST